MPKFKSVRYYFVHLRKKLHVVNQQATRNRSA